MLFLRIIDRRNIFLENVFLKKLLFSDKPQLFVMENNLQFFCSI